MLIGRRGFLQLLGTAASALLLEIPRGREFVSLSGSWKGIDEASIIAAELERISAYIPALFERDDAFFRSIAGYSPVFNVKKEGSIWVPLDKE